MPEKVNFEEEWKKKSLLEWLIIHAMAELEKDNDGLAHIASKISGARKEEGIDEVSLIINGIELPLRSTIEFWESQHDDMIKKEAKKLVNNTLFEIFDDVETIFSLLKRELKIDIYEKLGIKIEEDDDYD